MIYDCTIIGTGPAGISAALTLKARAKEFLLIGDPKLSRKISLAKDIPNYPGLANCSGDDLRAAFTAQLDSAGIAITDAVVNSILPMGDYFALMAGSDYYEAKTVILALGAAMSAPLPGEDRLLGHGVSYCATCDGMLYRGRTVAVIASQARFEPEAAFLASIAEQVYFFPGYTGAVSEAENMIMVKDRPAEILGEDKVTGVKLRSGEIIAVEGVFCLRDSVASSALLPGLAMDGSHIHVNRGMETNIPGVFAAGDCTGTPYQYTVAAGEGNIAAHSALKYLLPKA